MSEPKDTGHSCCGHCLPADTGIMVSGQGAVIPDVSELPEAQRAQLVAQVQDGRRIFLPGERAGRGIECEDGTPEPDPAVPVRSIVLVWTRHDDGLWRAVNSPNPEPHAHTWRSLLRTFPRLTEVLPGDANYPEP